MTEGATKASSAEARRSRPRPLAFVGDDLALVQGLSSGNPAAQAALFDRYAAHVRRVLLRVLGPDGELADALHDVFVQALGCVGELRDPAALKAWITSIAVFTARGRIRRRRRRRWLRLVAPADLPEQETPGPSAELSEAVRSTYAVLDRLPAEERIAFALRFIDGMELTEVALASGCSLATIKRRLARAGQLFFAEARHHPALASYLEDASADDGEAP
jgi:RNA polymerase sigma-70 factor, ECF subfamily